MGKEDLVSKAEEERKSAAIKIHEVFVAADHDGNGSLTKDEFIQALEREDVMMYLHEIGIDVRQAQNLFDVLDYDESGFLDAKEFLDGVMKARGEAKAKEILSVQCDVWRTDKLVETQLATLDRSAQRRMDVVEDKLQLLIDEVKELESQVDDL